MKRCILITASIAMVMAASTGPAFASTQGYYFSGLGGVSLFPSLGSKNSTGTAASSFDAGYAFGGAVGYDTGNGWRYELTSIYQMAGLNQFGGAPAAGHLWSTGLMANATYDLTRDTLLTPYIGAGLGVQDVGGTINGYSGDKWRPAYQLEAGLRRDLTPQVSLFGEYRFSQSEAAKWAGPTDYGNQHFSDHLLTAGITYHLGRD
jgi:opacity protein-like surface antigen